MLRGREGVGQDTEASTIINLRWFAFAVLVAACHHAAPDWVDAPVEVPPPSLVRDTTPTIRRVVRSDTALSAAERDSIVREVQARRAAWRARGIADYRIRVTVGCFCPWPQTPAILEVKGGVVAALRDTTGRAFGKVREPWSNYTVEGLFDAVEQGARRVDVLEVTYDGRFGYPTYISSDAKLGLPDDWFWVRATHLVPRP